MGKIIFVIANLLRLLDTRGVGSIGVALYLAYMYILHFNLFLHL